MALSVAVCTVTFGEVGHFRGVKMHHELSRSDLNPSPAVKTHQCASKKVVIVRVQKY